jgi:hypothetical protein
MPVATFVIDEQGNVKYLVNEATDKMFEGDAVKQRASHVEPDNWLFRIAFHMLRQVFGDRGRMSDLTRRWPCLWRVNTKPVGGPILEPRWRNRQEAIDAEIEFLVEWFVRS